MSTDKMLNCNVPSGMLRSESDTVGDPPPMLPRAATRKTGTPLEMPPMPAPTGAGAEIPPERPETSSLPLPSEAKTTVTLGAPQSPMVTPPVPSPTTTSPASPLLQPTPAASAFNGHAVTPPIMKIPTASITDAKTSPETPLRLATVASQSNESEASRSPPLTITPPKLASAHLQCPQKPSTMVAALSTVRKFLFTTRNASVMFFPLKEALGSFLEVWKVYQVCCVLMRPGTAFSFHGNN